MAKRRAVEPTAWVSFWGALKAPKPLLSSDEGKTADLAPGERLWPGLDYSSADRVVEPGAVPAAILGGRPPRPSGFIPWTDPRIPGSSWCNGPGPIPTPAHWPIPIG